MTGIETIEFQTRCETKLDWFFIAEKLGLFDIVLTIFIPFLIISVANVLISLKLMKSVISREAQDIDNSHRHESVVIPPITNLNLSVSAVGQRRQSYTKTTRMLMMISTVYLFLNAPIAFSKMRYFVTNLYLNDNTTNVEHLNNVSNHSSFSNQQKYNNSDLDELIERLTCYLYYLNFAINFLFYRLNCSKLIKNIFILFKIRRS
jgi:hypothetical protein